jgi:hypothetical protein
LNSSTINQRRIYEVVCALSAWTAVVLQFILMLNPDVPVTRTIIHFLSYFTILTNLLVAITFTVRLFSPVQSKALINSASFVSAVTVYILVVGIVYNTVLRALWAPDGTQMIVDEMLHTVNPLLCLLYWLFFVRRSELKYKSALKWLIYPVVFLVYSLVRGRFVNWYPYPFLDVNALGIERVLVNSLFVAALFLTLGLILVALSKMDKEK